MGRGKAKMKKMMVTTEVEDLVTSDKERVTSQKRRRRPQKQLVKDDEEEAVEIDDDTETENVIDNDETGSANLMGNGKKRKQKLRSKEIKPRTSPVKDSSGDGSVKMSIGDSSKPKSRRKSKPRRAAEAGVEIQIEMR